MSIVNEDKSYRIYKLSMQCWYIKIIYNNIQIQDVKEYTKTTLANMFYSGKKNELQLNLVVET